MTRRSFGATSADFLADSAGNTLAGFGTVWTAQTAGAQLTDVVDANGGTAGAVMASAGSATVPRGMVQFLGPDDATAVVWVDFGGGRVKVVSSDAWLSPEVALGIYAPILGPVFRSSLVTAPLGVELAPALSAGGGWAVSGGWSLPGATAVAVAGGGVLTSPVSVVAGRRYQVVWVGGSAGTINVQPGGVAGPQTFLVPSAVLAPVGTGPVTFTADGAFVGTLTSVSIKEIVSYSVASTSLADAAGVVRQELRGSSSSVAFGIAAQRSLTTGASNNAFGTNAQVSLATGSNNNAVGASAQYSLATGSNNNAVGSSAQYSLATGSNNNAFGINAQRGLSTATNNNAVGASAQFSLSSGANNNALGYAAQLSLTTGSNNNAVGSSAQYSLATGSDNNAYGSNAQRGLTTGANNNAVGASAQFSLSSGANNNALGYAAQLSLTTGANNTAVGASAQYSLATGSNNAAYGSNAQYAPAGNGAWATTTANRQTTAGTESGQGSAAQSDDITTIGYRALADAAGAVAIGSGSQALHATSVALGMSTITTGTAQVAVGPRDIECSITGKGLVIRSPDGTRYRIIVANGGGLSTIAA